MQETIRVYKRKFRIKSTHPINQMANLVVFSSFLHLFFYCHSTYMWKTQTTSFVMSSSTSRLLSLPICHSRSSINSPRNQKDKDRQTGKMCRCYVAESIHVIKAGICDVPPMQACKARPADALSAHRSFACWAAHQLVLGLETRILRNGSHLHLQKCNKKNKI